MFNLLWMYFFDHSQSPPRFHMDSTQNHLLNSSISLSPKSTSSPLHLESMESGLEETREGLEVESTRICCWNIRSHRDGIA